MNNIEIKDIKYKDMSCDDLIISIDRLSRFKLPETKYLRVFKEIIVKHLILPQISAKNLEKIGAKSIVKIVEIIWNDSAKKLQESPTKQSYTKLLSLLDKYYFKNIPDDAKILMSAKLDIKTPLQKYARKLPQNLQLLKELTILNKKILISDAKKIRLYNSTKFPIEKILLAEGITEEILLPVFAEKLNYNFNENGIIIIGAGGKSKIPALYTKLKDKVKLPIMIIVDNDALPVYNELLGIIKSKDKAFIIANGEFEDILPEKLIKRAINNNFYDIEKVTAKDFQKSLSMCENIENIYRTRQIGEFQKAHFAKIIAENVHNKTDISFEIEKIINEIKAI